MFRRFCVVGVVVVVDAAIFVVFIVIVVVVVVVVVFDIVASEILTATTESFCPPQSPFSNIDEN